MKKLIILAAAVMLIIFIGDISLALAQGIPATPSAQGGGFNAPIGGIVAAAAVGGAYAVNKLRGKSKA